MTSCQLIDKHNQILKVNKINAIPYKYFKSKTYFKKDLRFNGLNINSSRIVLVIFSKKKIMYTINTQLKNCCGLEY